MRPPLLVLNSGSSSIKFALFDSALSPPPRDPLWSGRVENIGGASPRWVAGTRSAALELDTGAPHESALRVVRSIIEQEAPCRRPEAIVHRVVHGGSRYTAPVRVDAEVLADLRDLIPLAPLHQPFALRAIETMLAEVPGIPQIACFDTAFHRTIPAVEQRFSLPHAQWERGIRRYGFHGLSYEYMTIALREKYGDAARGKTIVAHLGSGASLCAMRDLESVATTMGFSALDGLMMGTRCGALDPGAVLHLLESQKLGVERVVRMLYHESGLLGVSGLSSSPKDLLEVESREPRARAALELYVRRVVRELGALVAILGGLDTLAFTAGVGERSSALRARICEAFDWLGVAIDDEANRADAPVISAIGSRVRVVVEPTHEEWMAASHAAHLLRDRMPAQVSWKADASGPLDHGRPEGPAGEADGPGASNPSPSAAVDRSLDRPHGGIRRAFES